METYSNFSDVSRRALVTMLRCERARIGLKEEVRA